MNDLPWLQDSWRRLVQAHRQHRLGHALLLSGAPGIGKRQFIQAFVAGLLCQQPGEDGKACGHCRACILLQSNAHPDFMQIEPEEPGKPIRVDAIRAMIETMSLATHYGGLRVTVLDPAEAMNQYAANSLLKTLEEPPAQNILILISERPATLSATIRSRCQLVKLPRPAHAQALAWLQRHLGADAGADIEPTALLALADGAPLAAQALWEEARYADRHQAFENLLALSEGRIGAVALAERWLKQSPTEPIHWLYQWLSDVVRLANGLPAPRLQGLGGGALQAMLSSVNLRRLFRLHDRVVEAFRAEKGNLNPQLQLEALLLDWLDLIGYRPVTRS